MSSSDVKRGVSLRELAIDRGLLSADQFVAAMDHAGGDESRVLEAALDLGFVSRNEVGSFRETLDQLRAEIRVAQYLRDLGLVSDVDIEAALRIKGGRRLTDILRERADGPRREAISGAMELPEDVSKALERPECDLGRYILVSHIATGGVGSVWKAWQKDLRRYVAVKFLELTGQADIERFRREAVVLSQIEHQNIARVYDAGERGGKPYLVMQYVDGQTIDRLKLPPQVVARALLTIAQALDSAHRQGIVHRDIKPTNIMLDRNGQLFLMDFGMAKRIDVPAKLTITGTIMGTPAYMSPEQARGEDTDVRADIYSLGATAYELLSGKPPQEGGNLVETLERITHKIPVSVRKINPKVPVDLETIVMKCLSKEAERRYARAQDLGEDLRRFLAGEPVLAKRPTLMYRLRRRVRQHPWFSAAVGSAALILLAFGGYVLVEVLKRREQEATCLREAEDAERNGQWERALGAYERASTLDPSNVHVKRKKEEMSRHASEDRERLQDEAERAKQQNAAAEFYRVAAKELDQLRLRSYRGDWRLTEEELRYFEDLIQRCREQMKLTGESGDGWWIIGRAYHVLWDTDVALQSYAAGLKIDPNHPECLLYRARLLTEYAVMGKIIAGDDGERLQKIDQQMKEALELLTRGVATRKITEMELDLARGYEMVLRGKSARGYGEEMLKKWAGHDFSEEFHFVRALGNAKEAIQDYEAILAVRPRCYEAYFWRAVSRLDNDVAGKLEDLTKATLINPRYVEAFMSRGLLYQERKDLQAALDDFTRVVQINPRFAPGYLDRGNVYVKIGQNEKALADYTQAIACDSRWATAYHNRGNLYRAIHDTKLAMEDYTRSIDIRPTWSAYNGRGIVRMDGDDAKGAIADYDQGIKLDAKQPILFYNRGNARKASKDVLGAIEDYNRALALDPKMVVAYTNRATVRFALRQFKEALEDFDKAVELDAEDPVVYHNRGTARLRLKNFEGAIQDYTKAIELNPRSPKGYFERGVAYQEQEKFKEALEDFDKAVALAPKDASLHSQRGDARHGAGNLDGAIEDYTAAIDISPKVPKGYIDRAGVYIEKGEFKRAWDDLTLVLGVDPNNVQALVLRGMASAQMGKLEPSREMEHLKAAEADMVKALRVGDESWSFRPTAEDLLKRIRDRIAMIEKGY